MKLPLDVKGNNVPTTQYNQRFEHRLKLPILATLTIIVAILITLGCCLYFQTRKTSQIIATKVPTSTPAVTPRLQNDFSQIPQTTVNDVLMD